MLYIGRCCDSVVLGNHTGRIMWSSLTTRMRIVAPCAADVIVHAREDSDRAVLDDLVVHMEDAVIPSSLSTRMIIVSHMPYEEAFT